MSDKSNQQISNLMDGELEVNASQFLLKRMASDDSLSKTWGNYHMIKSCLQKQADEPWIDIASKVTQQLQNTDDGFSQQSAEVKTPLMQRWLKPVMGLGIAASVAFMSVTMLKNQQINGVQSPSADESIATVEVMNPILQTNINATAAASETTLMPPPSLSRYPTLSNQQTNLKLGEYNSQAPYIIIINRAMGSENTKSYSPIRSQDISD
ncbi:MAG: sigma-E factor negative regulatory protein [Marinicellaceae bacterium]